MGNSHHSNSSSTAAAHAHTGAMWGRKTHVQHKHQHQQHHLKTQTSSSSLPPIPDGPPPPNPYEHSNSNKNVNRAAAPPPLPTALPSSPPTPKKFEPKAPPPRVKGGSIDNGSSNADDNDSDDKDINRAPPPRPVSTKGLGPYMARPPSESDNHKSRGLRGSLKLAPGKWVDEAYLNEKHLGRMYGPLRCINCKGVIQKVSKDASFIKCGNCGRVTSELFARLIRTPKPPSPHGHERGGSSSSTSSAVSKVNEQQHKSTRMSIVDVINGGTKSESDTSAASNQASEQSKSSNLSPTALIIQQHREGDVQRVYIEDEWVLDAGLGENLHWVRVLTQEEEERVHKLYESLKDLDTAELRSRYEKIAKEEGIPSPTIQHDLDSVKNHDELVELLVVAHAWSASDFARAGFVRMFERNGELSWLPATEYTLDTRPHGLSPVQVSEISHAPFDIRMDWFRRQVTRLRDSNGEDTLNIRVRRDSLLEDSSTCFLTMSPKDFWSTCRYEFLGEHAMDSGGVAREFFTLVSNLIFDPSFGLFEPTESGNSLAYRINVNSGIANELHLQYFRFAGRLIGKALIPGYNVNAHLTPDIYKHILSAPLSIRDLAHVDQRLAKSAQDIMECDDVEALYLDFTTAVWMLGVTDIVELKENGANISVTNDNREEYLESLHRYVMLDRHHLQLSFFLRGFDEIIPASIVSIFTPTELERMICGNASIDVFDWMKHTEYRGEYKAAGTDHKVIIWFWDLLKSMSYEELAKLLMFSTGSERVPVQGFRALRGDDGSSMIFSIESIPLTQSLHPRAHTCFNRIELPLYKSREDLFKYIREGIEMGEGFTME